jgi:AcrR family transcriptional regulator
MTDLDETAEPVDGRVARRQRNIDAVLDVVLEMFEEESMLPTIEQVSTRSGLSLRSLYRYFADPGELLEATIKRSDERMAPIAQLSAIGEGPLSSRIDDFVGMRLRLYEVAGPSFRASVANASRHASIRAELARNRDRMREQFELQFEPELAKLKPAERQTLLASGELLTQLDSIDYLRRHRQLDIPEVEATLIGTLKTLLQ